MSLASFKKGIETISKSMEKKIEQFTEQVSNISNDIKQTTAQQDSINSKIIADQDHLRDEVQELKDSKFYIKSSRHSIDDMSMDEQQLLVAWLQKLLLEIKSKGFTINHNQQTFFANLVRYIGLMDENFAIESLDVLEKMGGSETHEAIYKIFVLLIYLQNEDFELLQVMHTVDNMFKLSEHTKQNLQALLQDRAHSLGVEGLINLYNQEKPINSFTLASILTSTTELLPHPALSWNLTEEESETYLISFALLAIPSHKDSNDEKVFTFNQKQREFLVALSKQLTQASLSKLDTLCKQPHQININKLKTLLNDENRKCTWSLDLIFLDSIKESLDDSSELFQEILRMLDSPKLESFIKNAGTFFYTENVQERGSVLIKIVKHTQGYKHIIKFGDISLENAYDEETEQVASWGFTNEYVKINWEIVQLGMLLLKRTTEAPIFAPSKSTCEKKLLLIKNNIIEFMNKYRHSLQNLESIISCFDIIPQNECDLYTIISQVENKNYTIPPSIKKEEWDIDEWDQKISELSDFLDKKLKQYTTICDNYTDQISLFEEGDFTSVWEKQVQQKQEKEEKKKAEHKLKESVQVTLNGEQKQCSITWETLNLSQAPFEAHTIKNVKFVSSNSFYLITKSNKCYQYNDGNWLEFILPEEKNIQDFYVIKGLPFISCGYNNYYYFYDNEWDQIITHENKMFIDGENFIKISTEEKKYEYIEEGVIWNSTKTDSYNAPVVHKASLTLDDSSNGWKKWEEAGNLQIGYILYGNLVSINNLTLTGIGYDYSYARNKKLEDDNYIGYLNHKTSSWQRCNLKKEFVPYMSDSQNSIYAWKDTFFVTSYKQISSSKDALTWRYNEIDMRIDNWLQTNNFIIITDSWEKDYITISSDGENFQKLAVEQGKWQFYDACDDRLIALFSPNEHEDYLRIGKFEY